MSKFEYKIKVIFKEFLRFKNVLFKYSLNNSF